MHNCCRVPSTHGGAPRLQPLPCLAPMTVPLRLLTLPPTLSQPPSNHPNRQAASWTSFWRSGARRTRPRTTATCPPRGARRAARTERRHRASMLAPGPALYLCQPWACLYVDPVMRISFCCTLAQHVQNPTTSEKELQRIDSAPFSGELELCRQHCQRISGQHQEGVEEAISGAGHACHTHQPCTPVGTQPLAHAMPQHAIRRLGGQRGCHRQRGGAVDGACCEFKRGQEVEVHAACGRVQRALQPLQNSGVEYQPGMSTQLEAHCSRWAWHLAMQAPAHVQPCPNSTRPRLPAARWRC